MVGYAYSADSELGYNYITIKSYDCDDISFVSDSTSFQLYRINRKDSAVCFVHPAKSDVLRHLSYKNISEIVHLFLRAEYKANYPLKVLWSITPSGVCEIKSKEDYNLLWPLTPYEFDSENGYVNIDKLFFRGSMSFLKSSFVAQVINEVAYCLGIYISDVVAVIGNKLYLSFSMAHILKSLFGYNNLLTYCQSLGIENIKARKRLSRGKIIKLAKNFKVTNSFNCDFSAKELCSIKSECIYDFIMLIGESLGKKESLMQFIKKLRSVFDKAFLKLELQKHDFAFYSGGKSDADINYLSFDDLLMTYSFGSFKKEMADKIKLNRSRNHELKNLEAPKAIYKGRLIFE